MIGKRILGWLFALAITAASGAAVYRHLHTRASHRVRTEILRVADDMDLPANRREDVKRFIAGAHDEAFDRALDVTRTHGRKFDEQLYFSEVFDRVIAQARAANMDDLAETIDRQRRQFSFTVTEH